MQSRKINQPPLFEDISGFEGGRMLEIKMWGDAESEEVVRCAQI